MFGSRQSGLHQYAEAIELYDTATLHSLVREEQSSSPAIETSIVNNKFTSLVSDTVTVLLYQIVNGLMLGNTSKSIEDSIEKYK